MAKGSGGVIILLVLTLLFTVVLACAAAPEVEKPPVAPKAEPIVLKALTSWPEGDMIVWSYYYFIEKLNERAKGELIIEYLGTTEVYATGRQ